MLVLNTSLLVPRELNRVRPANPPEIWTLQLELDPCNVTNTFYLNEGHKTAKIVQTSKKTMTGNLAKTGSSHHERRMAQWAEI